MQSGRGEPDLRPPGAGLAAVSGPDHQALVWREGGGWVDPVLEFVQDGIDRQEPVSVGVSVARGRLLREVLGGHPLVAFFDMTELGRNPSRIISAMLDFAGRHASPALRYVSEPLWAGQSAAERAEAARHEALVDLAFGGTAATVMCLYSADRLDAPTISCAQRTHSVIIADGRRQPSPSYAGPGILPPECDQPLTPPPAAATRLDYRDNLRAVRAQVTACAKEAGLAEGRIADLVLAASEVAANTLRYAGGRGTLQVWRGSGEIVCQASDAGHIRDPLAGRRRPPAEASGQGLWVVNQVCDLVELRSGPDGTTVRMHVRL